MMRRLVASVYLGFVATIALTGLYAIPERISYGGAGYDSLFPVESFSYTHQNVRFGFPFTWVEASTYQYPPILCQRCPLGAYRSPPTPIVKFDWTAFMLDLSLFAASSYPLTFLSTGAAPRFRAEAKVRLPRLKNRVVIGSTALCLGWLIVYSLSSASGSFIASGSPPLVDNYREALGSFSLGYLHLEVFLLLFFSLVGIAGGILSTWKFLTGGIVLGFSSAFLLFFPGFVPSMLLLNPEFAMLYILWTSTMLTGGLLSLRKAIQHLRSAREQRHE